MSELSNKQLKTDVTESDKELCEKIYELEQSLSIIHNNFMVLAEQIKTTQQALIKVSKNLSDVTTRVSQWPYVSLSNQK